MPGKEDGGLQVMKRLDEHKAILPQSSNGEIQITLRSGASKKFPCKVSTEFIPNVVIQDKEGKISPLGDIQSWSWEAVIVTDQPISIISVTLDGKQLTRKSFVSPILKWPSA